jgi:hypothetical protein
MTAQNTTGRGIVDLDARVVEATVSLVKRAGLLDQIVATLGRGPSWPR